MQREYPQQPLVGVGAIIVDAGRVVLVKRANPPLAGEWSIPGGLLELGETIRQAVEREALEETGLTVRTTDLMGVFDRIVPAKAPANVSDEESRTIYHYVLIDFLCEKLSGDLHASGDAADARWFTLEEIGRLPLAEDTTSVIRLALSLQDR